MSIINKSLLNEFNILMGKQWVFLNDKWPEMKPSKYHRTEIKIVSEIDHVKQVVLEKLGPIPVFFFFLVLFPFKHHPGPYRNVEKGLLILYHILKGGPHSDMGRFIAQSSFYDIHKSFYGHEQSPNTELDDQVTTRLSKMFSTLRIRILSAKANNPVLFKTVTLLLDGHDTRGTRTGSRSEDGYSYKLKKAGFRTQVCIDVNGMVIMTSGSLPCKDNSDGVMFTKMGLDNTVQKGDCLAVDGGYTLFIKQVVEKSDLKERNFCHPIRKLKNVELSDEEKRYNERFGSFRSIIEGFFGELGTVFEKFNNRRSIRTTDTNIFNLQFRVACLLLNVKKFVELGHIEPYPHHMSWLENQFDYPSEDTLNFEALRISTLKEKQEDSEKLSKYQAQILAGSTLDESDEEMEDTFEVERILDHKGKGKNKRYLVKWKGYKKTTWQGIEDFDTTQCIDDYWETRK